MCLFFNSKYDFENIIHQPDFFGGVSIQKSMDPILEEYAKKSIEFASKWHFPSIIIESLMLKKSQNTNRIQQFFFFSFPDMGNRLAASGQYEKAVKCFTEAIKFNPKEFK